MIDPWELLLHHSYSGKPGVIFDQSPGRTNHGTPINLSDSDFLRDGADSGSGAIAFHPGSSVRVTPAKRWTPLPAIRCEIVCSCDGSGANAGTLINADSCFALSINKGGTPLFGYNNASGGFGGFVPHAPKIPLNQWFTLGVTYDGWSRSAFTLDGVEVDTFDTADTGPLRSTSHISIGNSIDGSRAWTGRIDDVKVWRLNPHRVDNAFTNRPVDPGLQDCWGRWNKALGKALRDDPECAEHVRDLINAAIASLIQRAAASSPTTESTWQAAVTDYQQRWLTGDLHGLQATLADVIAAIGGDLQLKSDPALAALGTDPCMQKIASKLPKLDCDPQFIDLLRNTAKQIEVLP